MRFTYVHLVEAPEKLFAVRTERGLAEKFRNEFMAINFVDSENAEKNSSLQLRDRKLD